MKRILPLACMILLCAAPLIAEESNSGTTDETETTVEYEYKMNQPGDQFIAVSLAGSLPLSFGNVFTGNSQLSFGGIGTIGYHYFLTENFAIGADVGFGFNVTIGSNVYNYIPILATATYQPSYKHFEFPLSMGIGIATETYIGYKYFPGLVIKPEVGAFYRLTPSWSLGADASYLFLPQFAALYNDNATNILAQFITVGIAARYHF